MFIGMVFEAVIIISASTLLILIFKKCLEKKHKLTLYLLIIFLNFTIAIVFSWLSKVLRLYSGLDYLTNPSVKDPGTLESWFLLRIVAFRFTMIFVTIAILFTYVLKINIFEKESNKIQKVIVFLYAGFSIVYMLFVYIKGNLLLDIVTFSIVLIYMSMIYIPFIIRSFKAYKGVEDSTFKKAFLSLIIMAICLILIFICQIIDRVLMIILDISGYTFFYFLGWTFAIIAILCAYLGYIRPKSKE
ncbi:MAG: hypothetical protein ACFFAH_00720 [Promethearchaeota archaeon]